MLLDTLPFQRRFLKKGGKAQKLQKGKSKGRKCSASRRFFRPYRKGGGKGKKSGKTDSSSASKQILPRKNNLRRGIGVGVKGVAGSDAIVAQ